MRAGNPGVPTASEWVADVLAPGGRVGIDPVSYTTKPSKLGLLLSLVLHLVFNLR